MKAARYEREVRSVDAAASAPFAASTPCAVCAAREARPRYAIQDVTARLVVCTRCGAGRLDPMPGEDELAAYYPDDYYGDPGTGKFQRWIELGVRLVAMRHAGAFLSELAPGARVLDVGCGRGLLLSEIVRRGFEAHGLERSEPAARGADPRARIRIAKSLRDAGYPASSFDAVVVWHVLEHLRDPRAMLVEAHRILRPGGAIVVAVPNFSSAQARWAGPAWFHLDLPRHLHLFPAAGLVRLLETSGFRCASIHHFSLRQNPFGWIQSALNRDPSLPRNGLYTLLHRRSVGAEAPFDRRTRRRLLVRGAFLTPLAIALALAETAARSGATVHVVARRAG